MPLSAHKQAKTDYCLAFALACLFFVITFAMRGYAHVWGDDFAGYILEAKALVQGTIDQIGADLVTLHPSPLPNAALSESSRLYYVWGLPMMLVPFVSNAIDSLPEMLYQMKLINCFCISGIAAIGYLFFRRRFQTGLSVALTFMLCGSVFAWVNRINNDVPELFFVLACFYLYECCTERKRNCVLPVLLGIAMYCACAMRLNGFTVVVFLAFATVWDCIRSRSFHILRVLPFLLAGLLYGIQLYFLPEATSNLSDVQNGFSLQGIFRSLDALYALGRDILNVRTTIGNVLITGVLALLGLLGAVRHGFRKELPYLLFFAATFLVLATLPYNEGSRYYMNTLPIVIALIGYGMQTAVEYLRQHSGSAAGILNAASIGLVIVCVLYCALFSHWRQTEIATDSYENAVTPNYLSVYSYISDHTPEDAVIAYSKPRMIKLATDRLSFSPDANRHNLSDADYLLTLTILEPSLTDEQQTRLEVEYQNDDFILYRITK